MNTLPPPPRWGTMWLSDVMCSVMWPFSLMQLYTLSKESGINVLRRVNLQWKREEKSERTSRQLQSTSPLPLFFHSLTVHLPQGFCSYWQCLLQAEQVGGSYQVIWSFLSRIPNSRCSAEKDWGMYNMWNDKSSNCWIFKRPSQSHWNRTLEF